MTAKKKAGRPRKYFSDFLQVSEQSELGKIEDYYKNPVVSFLNYLCLTHYAVEYCKSQFIKNDNGTLGVEPKRHLNIILISVLPTIMGQFETFQKSIFAKCIEHSLYIKDFSLSDFIKRFKDIQNLEIDTLRLMAYRGQSAQTGSIIADSLHIWHDSSKVNAAFRAITLGPDFYTKDVCDELQILWQLRHSIVHTGATITRPDSQKFQKLKKFADKNIVFEKTFISNLGSRLHKIIKESVSRYSADFFSKLLPETPQVIKSDISELFKIDSKMKTTWLT